MEWEQPYIGGRYGFRGPRLPIPGIAPPNQDSVAGSPCRRRSARSPAPAASAARR